ncbi:hypothetical protein SJAG_00473 [Schizosaccharomyces japonicus yFS275]|uniref:DRBM domain-containing protein n=1 Tax=Schizosaccharomyces japonicus (strain yFS275 / FY16936) TaxID=402676 RepID=B6JVQ8_SCHJY|nr:hypothetical protein SJAG_00473 [Schizosaccharomyces japonicus yFS275]EEB05459.1 hypothetical protein SJAG_00473 [Schizosaccharomyces japonicus yFS275]
MATKLDWGAVKKDPVSFLFKLLQKERSAVPPSFEYTRPDNVQFQCSMRLADKSVFTGKPAQSKKLAKRSACLEYLNWMKSDDTSDTSANQPGSLPVSQDFLKKEAQDNLIMLDMPPCTEERNEQASIKSEEQAFTNANQQREIVPDASHCSLAIKVFKTFEREFGMLDVLQAFLISAGYNSKVSTQFKTDESGKGFTGILYLGKMAVHQMSFQDAPNEASYRSACNCLVRTGLNKLLNCPKQ